MWTDKFVTGTDACLKFHVIFLPILVDGNQGNEKKMNKWNKTFI